MTAINLEIFSGNDIALQSADTTASSITLDPTYLNVRNNATEATRRHGGLRFTTGSASIIPPSATINSATLHVYQAATVDDWDASVYGDSQAVSDGFEPFTGDNRVFTRPRTSASASSQLINMVEGDDVALDVTSIVQEVVNGVGWDALAVTILMIGGSATNYNWFGFNRTSGSLSPNLDVDYTAATAVNVSLNAASITSAA